MSITCDCCSHQSHFDSFVTDDPARFRCRRCGAEWGLQLCLGYGKKKVRTVVYHDPRQQALFDLAAEGDEAAVDELFKRGAAK